MQKTLPSRPQGAGPSGRPQGGPPAAKSPDGWAVGAVGELAGSIAREIGSPLTAIEVAVDRLQRRHTSPSRDEPAVELQVILEQSHRLAGLARTLLSLARPVEGRRRPFHLDRVVDDVLNSRRSELDLGGIRLELRHEEPGLEVEADPHQLREALGTLLENARIALGDWDGPRTIHVHTGTLEGERVFVRIQDTGPGVPLGQEEHIFLPFVSGWGREGIGLALCRIALLGQGGEIFLEEQAKEGNGAAFILILGTGPDGCDD
jgi:two-component system, NtrC family, sensor histidine kinase HydH